MEPPTGYASCNNYFVQENAQTGDRHAEHVQEELAQNMAECDSGEVFESELCVGDLIGVGEGVEDDTREEKEDAGVVHDSGEAGGEAEAEDSDNSETDLKKFVRNQESDVGECEGRRQV